MSFPRLFAVLPGVGNQFPTTECIQIEGFVTASSKKALLIKFPELNRTEWLARSQLCEEDDKGTSPDVDRFSAPGASGKCRIPWYIAKRWLEPHRYVNEKGPRAETARSPKEQSQ